MPSGVCKEVLHGAAVTGVAVTSRMLHPALRAGAARPRGSPRRARPGARGPAVQAAQQRRWSCRRQAAGGPARRAAPRGAPARGA